MRKNRTLVLTQAALALAVIAVWASPAAADHGWVYQGKQLHWAAAASGTVSIEVVDSMTPDYDTYLDEALNDWNQSAYLNLTKVAGADDASTRQSCPTINGKIRVCNAEYGQTGWLGIAGLDVDADGHILWAYAKMNDSYSSMSDPDWRDMVTCQEVGHDFGLGHQDENQYNGNLGSCMDYTANPAGPPSNLQPNQHDYDMLAQIYSHTDGGRVTPPSEAALNVDPNDVGFLIYQSHARLVYVNPRVDGGALFTFVTLAPEGMDH